MFLPSSGCRPTLLLNITSSDTAIADTGASRIYLTPKAPCSNINPAALQIVVGIAGGPPHHSLASCDINLLITVTKGHLMPNFHHNLMGIGPLYEHGFRVLFEKHMLLFLPKSTQSYYVAGMNPLEPSCGGSPSTPNIIHRCHQNGALAQLHSMHMTCQVWDTLSAIYTRP